jgi:hypothetical protein
MSLLLNRAKVVTATTGTGTVNLGASVSPYTTYALAGAATGRKYSNLIEDGAAWEISEGVYTAGSPDTMTRVLIASSTGALLNLSGTATIACVANTNDMPETLLETYATDNVVGTKTFNVPPGFSAIKFLTMGVAPATGLVDVRVNNLSGALYQLQRVGAANGSLNVQSLLQTSWRLDMSGSGLQGMELLFHRPDVVKTPGFFATGLYGGFGSGSLANAVWAGGYNSAVAITSMVFTASAGVFPLGGIIKMYGIR